MKLNKTICFAFASATTMLVLYSASMHMKMLRPLAAEASIDQLAAIRYQQYSENDPVGEKAIAQNAFPWRHEIWKGDDKPYQEARQEVDASIAAGTSPFQLAEEYQKPAQENSQSPLAQFRWAYALWKTITPTSTSAEARTNGLGAFFTLANTASPNTYN